jgi:hypothetical protein
MLTGTKWLSVLESAFRALDRLRDEGVEASRHDSFWRPA